MRSQVCAYFLKIAQGAVSFGQFYFRFFRVDGSSLSGFCAGCYTFDVRRKPIIWIVIALLAVLLAGPVFEIFDHWDNVPETGNDSLLSVVLLLTFAGALFAVRRFTITALRVLYRLRAHSTILQRFSLAPNEVARFELDTGPISSLSSLRI